MGDVLKSLGVGLATIIGACWIFYAVVFVLIALFSAGAGVVGFPTWAVVVALIPWGLAALGVVVMIGDDIRRKG